MTHPLRSASFARWQGELQLQEGEGEGTSEARLRELIEKVELSEVFNLRLGNRCGLTILGAQSEEYNNGGTD